jgi:hypothetical protein
VYLDVGYGKTKQSTELKFLYRPIDCGGNKTYETSFLQTYKVVFSDLVT